MFKVYYYNFGYKYTEQFTKEEAIKVIEEETPYENVKKMGRQINREYITRIIYPIKEIYE